MKILDKYILLEWLKIFVLALFITLGLLLLEDMYNNLPDFLNQRVKGRDILYYYFLLIPSFLPMMLPIGLLISILFTLGNMHRNNEIIAMQTARLNILRITRPLLIASVCLTGLLFFLNAFYIPKTVEQSRNFEERLKRGDFYAKSESIVTHRDFTFDNSKDNRLWFMNGFDEEHYRGYGVSVYIMDDSGKEIVRLQAREAYFDTNEDHWVFKDGRELYFSTETGEPIRSLPFVEKIEYEINDPPEVMAGLSKRPKMLSFFELKKLIATIPTADNPKINTYLVQYHGILAGMLSCLIVTLLAIPFAIGGVRVNPMVGVSKCAGLFFAYYLAVNICSLLGKQQLMPAILAAWIPNIIIMSVAVYLYRKLV